MENHLKSRLVAAVALIRINQKRISQFSDLSRLLEEQNLVGEELYVGRALDEGEADRGREELGRGDVYDAGVVIVQNLLGMIRGGEPNQIGVLQKKLKKKTVNSSESQLFSLLLRAGSFCRLKGEYKL